MASEKQRSSNRRNAAKSTGPKSESGRRKVAQNALRHGFSSKPFDARSVAAAQEWATEFCAEDPNLEPATALIIGGSLLRLFQVAAHSQDLVQLAASEVPEQESMEVRDGLARIQVINRLSAVGEYERRAVGALQKALRHAWR